MEIDKFLRHGFVKYWRQRGTVKILAVFVRGKKPSGKVGIEINGGFIVFRAQLTRLRSKKYFSMKSKYFQTWQTQLYIR